jgi:uncharacterized membrane protein YoaK (UPF0700 family)
MPNQVLGGPVWWFFLGLYLLAIALALFCLVDSLLPRHRERFAQLPEPAWLYTAVFAVFVAFVAGVWLPIVPRIVAVVPVFMTPVVLAVGVAYLLRVVFPIPQLAEASFSTDASDDPPQASAF